MVGLGILCSTPLGNSGSGTRNCGGEKVVHHRDVQDRYGGSILGEGSGTDCKDQSPRGTTFITYTHDIYPHSPRPLVNHSTGLRLLTHRSTDHLLFILLIISYVHIRGWYTASTLWAWEMGYSTCYHAPHCVVSISLLLKVLGVLDTRSPEGEEGAQGFGK